jgi:membrane protease YdiL (CAAX protease family)
MSENNRSLFVAALGVVAAVAITSTMDANGLAAFSALPLFPIVLAFWYFQKLSRRELGLTWSRPVYYGLALLHSLAVMLPLAGLAFAMHRIDVSETDWSVTALNVFVGGPLGIIMGLITEELFFRGWLWATLQRAGLGNGRILAATSVTFVLWHLSAIILPTGFNVPLTEVPVYLANALLLGAIWGLLRLLSGSIVVASVGHSIWNALAYSLFGFGTRVGDLGIQSTNTFGPETGWLGIPLNLAFFACLMALWLGRRPHREMGQRRPLAA